MGWPSASRGVAGAAAGAPGAAGAWDCASAVVATIPPATTAAPIINVVREVELFMWVPPFSWPRPRLDGHSHVNADGERFCGTSRSVAILKRSHRHGRQSNSMALFEVHAAIRGR